MNQVVKLLFVEGLKVVVILIAVQTSAPRLMAIPAFARKYHTSCSTCHSNWPELNDFGRAFKINGFKFPKDDEEFVKEPPLMLGAEAQKESFPYSIYPGELPILPISFSYSGNLSYTSPQPPAVSAAVGYVPKTDLFQPNTFTIIAASSLGPSFEWWIDDDLSTGGSGAAGGLGDGYIKVNDVGHYFHLPTNALNVRFGQFELDLPFSQARSINPSGYDIFDQVSVTGPGGLVNNAFAMGQPQRGFEIGGYPNNGNFWWSLALVDGNNTDAAVRNGKDVYFNTWKQFN